MRDPFWRSTSILLNYKRQLAFALAGAGVSAACFGAGISMIYPTLAFLLDQQLSVADLIRSKLVTEDRPAAIADLGRWLADHVPDDRFAAFLCIIAVIALLTLIGSTGRFIHEMLTVTVVHRAAMVWRARMFRRLIRAPLELILRQGSSDHISRVVFDTRPLARGYTAILGRSIEHIFKGAMALCVAMIFDWRLTLIALVTAPPVGILLRKFGKRIRRSARYVMRQRGHMVGALKEAMGGIRVVKVNNAEGYERRRFARINRRLYAQEMRVRLMRALATPMIEFLSLIGMLLVASIAAYYIFRSGRDSTTFMTVLVALGLAAGSLKPLATLSQVINEGRAAAERLYELLETPTEPTGPDVRFDLPALGAHREAVVFEDVSFTYQGQPEPAVDHFSLQVPFGQTIAIAGGNGSGKTTLVSLLPRLLEPTEGRILIDGQSIAGVRLRSLRQQIAVVTQQTVLFEGTIAQNIAYGRRHATPQQIIDSATAAYADPFITELPQGYETMLGEGGEGLSGGQQQRIAIARAILRDPTIFILDEATSQIDADSESKINLALRKLRHGRTVFVIAHRLSTVLDADRIIVLDAGRIIDQGSHDELIGRCDLYRTLTQTQMLDAG